MRYRTTIHILIWCLSAAAWAASDAQMLELAGDLGVHDPAIIRQGQTFYIFSTGQSRRDGGVIPIRCSQDLYDWSLCGYVFDRLPQWATDEIPAARSAWAPDISYFNNRYHLYYSVSTFGRNDSAIGLATNATLDANSPDYRWQDQGLAVRSRPGRDDWNAIDGNIVIEDADNVWLCWGSFWSGIKMRRIDPQTGKLSQADTTLHRLAARPRKNPLRPQPGDNAVEAPFIIRHGDHWYLFVSFDLCCRGVNSTYNIVVGRSDRVTGPYTDKAGTPMLDGGGTMVLEATTANWRGPGHPALLREGSGDYLVFHAYHGVTGRSELKIASVEWRNGWPHVAPLP